MTAVVTVAGGSASPLSATDAERFRRGATDGRRIAMASVSVSIGVAVLTFGVGLLGLYLKRLVPERTCPQAREGLVT